MAARLTAYLVVAIVGVTLIAGLIVGAQRDDSDGPVDLIVHNAAIYTADRRGTMAEAVAVRGNRILRVGSNRDIARLQRPQTIVVDARGGAVVPGFNDAHLRLIAGGLALAEIDLSGAESASDLLARLSSWSAAQPPDAWIVGKGWSAAHFRSGLPTRQLLDSAIPDRPVLLRGGDERSWWANTRALRLAGITRATADPVNGAIVRDPRTSEPSGVLKGAAGNLVSRVVPPPTREQRAAALRSAVAEANALGVTSVQSTADTDDAFELYEDLRRSGEMTLRVYSAISVDEPLTEAALARLHAARERYPDDPLFKLGALSISLDGSVATRTAALLAPYAESNESGNAAFASDDLNRTVRLADAAGWQIITRASGDRAVRMALNAYAHAIRSNRLPERGRRHRLERPEVVDAMDLNRFAPLSVTATLAPAGAAIPAKQLLGDLGKDRIARAFAFGDIAEEARIAMGSGWPDYPLNPMVGIAAAVQGPIEADDEAPAKRLELKPAIDAYTSAAAWASFDDQRKGSISAGMLADLVVLTDDVFALPAEKLSTVSVAFTVFDGKIVYRKTPRLETEPAPSLQH